jgi:hypothetical protein
MSSQRRGRRRRRRRRRRGQPRHTGIEPGVEKEIKNKVCQQNRTMTLLMLIYIFTRSNARVLC